MHAPYWVFFNRSRSSTFTFPSLRILSITLYLPEEGKNSYLKTVIIFFAFSIFLPLFRTLFSKRSVSTIKIKTLPLFADTAQSRNSKTPSNTPIQRYNRSWSLSLGAISFSPKICLLLLSTKSKDLHQTSRSSPHFPLSLGFHSLFGILSSKAAIS